MTRIILIGYMGAGKTTIGKILAKDLGVPFYDLDWYIETRMRKKVKQIFDERGEEGFRIIEKNMLHEVAEFENVVVACGGGTPCFFDNMEYLVGQGDVVYLRGTPDVLFRHLKMGKGVRPLLLGKSDEELLEYIKENVEKREEFYMKANHIVDIPCMEDEDKILDTTEKIKTELGL
jgi:shikimate kinase